MQLAAKPAQGVGERPGGVRGLGGAVHSFSGELEILPWRK
jgi:hypothetical protein